MLMELILIALTRRGNSYEHQHHMILEIRKNTS